MASTALALGAWTALAFLGVEPFRGWYYHFAWYTTLVGLDAGLAWREGRWPLFGRSRFALSLFLWSIPVWLLFEAANLRIANWYYVNATPEPLLRRLGTAAAFATVLPAIFLGHRWMDSLGLARGWRGPSFRVRPWHLAALFAGGVAFLAAALWRPSTFYPLIWGAATLLLEPWNWRHAPEGSLFGDLSRGEYGRIARLLAGGAAIGLLWEALNAPAATRWIYTVPGFEAGKLFEMPLPGYLGFPVFAVDCFVIYRALVTLRVAVPGWHRGDGTEARASGPAPGRTVAAAGLAAAFSLAVMAGMDHWTVDSWASAVRDLPGVGVEDARVLGAAGLADVRAVAEAPPERVAAALGAEPSVGVRLVETARLAGLRGIGTRNAAALRRAGIGSVCELARADEREIAAAVRAAREDPHAGRPARVRVWIRAAAEACPAPPGGGRGDAGRDGAAAGGTAAAAASTEDRRS